MTDHLTPELAAFAAECRAVEATLGGVSHADDERPGLGDWPLGLLLGHLVGVAGRLDRYAAAGVAPGPPAIDRLGYYPADQSGAPVQAQTAAEDAEAVADRAWAEAFAEAWRASANRAVALGPDAVLRTPRGTMAAREYLATRVLEVAVHHLDLRAALDLPPVNTPEAGRLTMDLLEGLLGRPRPRAMGRTRFVLAATGRLAVDDHRFPLLS
jgi:hypothetical protein